MSYIICTPFPPSVWCYKALRPRFCHCPDFCSLFVDSQWGILCKGSSICQTVTCTGWPKHRSEADICPFAKWDWIKAQCLSIRETLHDFAGVVTLIAMYAFRLIVLPFCVQLCLWKIIVIHLVEKWPSFHRTRKFVRRYKNPPQDPFWAIQIQLISSFWDTFLYLSQCLATAFVSKWMR